MGQHRRVNPDLSQIWPEIKVLPNSPPLVVRSWVVYLLRLIYATILNDMADDSDSSSACWNHLKLPVVSISRARISLAQASRPNVVQPLPLAAVVLDE